MKKEEEIVRKINNRIKNFDYEVLGQFRDTNKTVVVAYENLNVYSVLFIEDFNYDINAWNNIIRRIIDKLAYEISTERE